MHRHLLHTLANFAALLTLLAHPVASYSQNGYQVEFTAGFFRDKTTIAKLETSVLAAEVFFEEVTMGSRPYAEAAFLEHASSLAIAYSDIALTQTSYDADGTINALFAYYVVPDSLLILDILYGTSDVDYKNGLSGTAESNYIGVGIGTYLSDHSTIEISYLKRDTDFNIISSTLSTSEQAATNIAYKLVEELTDGTAFNFETSITSSKYEARNTSETNTIIEFSGDYYQNQSTSVGASIGINSGDDKGDEGKALGLNVNMFLTPTFALYAEFSQFKADNASGEDADQILFGGIARF